MGTPQVDAPRSHLLLPFEAAPEVVGRLRRTVELQLATWGVPELADVAELAVSELASNVIRHVGERTPAALVMERHGDRVRLELHDTSKAMPHRELAGPDDVCGRGLMLVTAVSNGWSAIPTPGGKAVCCEFTLSAPATPRPHNPHAARGSEAVQLYALRRTAPNPSPLHSLRAVDSVTTDLITDLLHWLAANGRDPDTVLDHAQTRFEAERGEVARDRLG